VWSFDSLAPKLSKISPLAGVKRLFSKQALANSILATVEPGDEVVLIAPYYSVYRQMVVLAGGIPVVVSSDPASGFALPVAEISRALSPRTRWILLNSPCNPTGRVTTADELRALWSCIAAHPDVGVLSDQVYELLTFDGRIAPCMASICPEAAERTVLATERTVVCTQPFAV